MGLKDKILSANDIASEMMTIEEWGVEIEVKGMTGAERAQIMEVLQNNKDNVPIADMLVKIFIFCAYDPETNEQIFTLDDIDEVNAKNGSAIERVAIKALELSGLTADSLDQSGKDS